MDGPAFDDAGPTPPSHSAPASEHPVSTLSAPDALGRAAGHAELATRALERPTEAASAPAPPAPDSPLPETGAREPARPEPLAPAPTGSRLQPPAVIVAAASVPNGQRNLDGELAGPETTPTVETLDAGLAHTLPDARIAPDAVRSTAPPPARLATSLWMERLTAEADRVQVSLGEDGSVRLRTLRQAEGVTVHLQFSDPEMQALASAHVDRLRDALETHFAEPVRLALADAGSNGAGAHDAGANGAGTHDADGRSDGSPPSPTTDLTPVDAPPDGSPHPLARAAADGRREWIG